MAKYLSYEVKEKDSISILPLITYMMLEKLFFQPVSINKIGLQIATSWRHCVSEIARIRQKPHKYLNKVY